MFLTAKHQHTTTFIFSFIHSSCKTAIANERTIPVGKKKENFWQREKEHVRNRAMWCESIKGYKLTCNVPIYSTLLAIHSQFNCSSKEKRNTCSGSLKQKPTQTHGIALYKSYRIWKMATESKKNNITTNHHHRSQGYLQWLVTTLILRIITYDTIGKETTNFLYNDTRNNIYIEKKTRYDDVVVLRWYICYCISV